MSKVIGIASEGPTDYLVLKTIIDRITGEENRYLRLQPEEDMMGRYGNGWKGVWKWCKETTDLELIMDSIQPRIDIVVIQVDGDVVRKEREVHCQCDSTVCEEKGKEFPLYCEKAIKGMCSAEVPCKSHSREINDVINEAINEVLTENESIIIKLITEDPEISIPQIAKNVNLSKATIDRAIKTLKEKDVLTREGAKKNGRWIIKKKQTVNTETDGTVV